jgi:ATP dependent DNA ligase domain
MEGLSVESLPVGDEWQYEPKWDGFRCLAFREGSKIHLQSKSGQPLSRYFPELTTALRRLKPKMFVLDLEIAVPVGRGFSFDALLQRIHPATSRVRRLAAEIPSIYVVFDLLAAEDGRSFIEPATQNAAKPLARICRSLFRQKDDPVVAGHVQARASQKVAYKNGDDARRHHRKTTRLNVSIWRARWDAKN